MKVTIRPSRTSRVCPSAATGSTPAARAGRAGHQEVPAEPQPLLRQQPAQARLGQQVAAVAVGEEPLGRVVGVLGVHPPAEDRLELVAALRMQIHRVQAGAERQPRAHQPAVQLHLVTADEQPEVGHADRFQRRRAEQRTVEQRGDAGQQILRASVRNSLTRRRHASPRRSGNASRSGSSRSHTIGDTSASPCLLGAGQQRRKHMPGPAGGRRRRPATPSPRPARARAACPARNRLRRRGFGATRDRSSGPADRRPGRGPDRRCRCRRRSGGRGAAVLSGQRIQRLGEFVGAPVRDHDGEDGVTHRALSRRRLSSRTSRTWRAASSPS